jgi:hypothetical protein
LAEQQELEGLNLRNIRVRYDIVNNILDSLNLPFPYRLILTGSGGLWLSGMMLHRPPGDLDVVIQVLPEEQNHELGRTPLTDGEKIDAIIYGFHEWKEKFTTSEMKTTGYCEIDPHHKFIGIPLEGVKVDVFATSREVECCPVRIAGMYVTTPRHTLEAKCNNLEHRPDLAIKSQKDIAIYRELYERHGKNLDRLVNEYETAQEAMHQHVDEIDTEDVDFSAMQQGTLF